MITVIGMGTNKNDLTLGGMEAIKGADIVVVKSEKTHVAQTVKGIRKEVVYCDDLYESATDFDQLNKQIEERLNSYGNKKVAFCVVGEGADDSTVQSLSVPFSIIHGVSLGSTVTEKSVEDGVRIFNAIAFTNERYILPVPTIVKCIDDQFVCADVQLKLLSAFDSDTPVVFFDGKNVKNILLSDLCGQKYNYQACLYITPKDFLSRQTFAFYDTARVMRRLRQPDGCPWDKEQTHESITNNVIEESYELVNAIQNHNIDNMIEELGDLLMQVLFHQCIAEEDGEFMPEEVFTALCRKLIDRHPHVFKGETVDNAEDSLKKWNAVKQQEHKIKGTAENVLDVPRGMSALIRTEKIQSRASKGGYEFENLEQCVGKVSEELNEFLVEYHNKTDKVQMEAGDLLFAVVNVLRMCKVDPETALLMSTDKFTKRVVNCEKLLEKRGQTLKELSMSQFDDLWAEAKRVEE